MAITRTRATTSGPVISVSTVEQFRFHALELMRLRGAEWYTGRCVYHALTPTTNGLALEWMDVDVPSATIPDMRYTARYLAAEDTASCDCPAGKSGHPCFHAGVAISYGRKAAEMQARLAGQRDDRDQARHEGNAAAIEPSL